MHILNVSLSFLTNKTRDPNALVLRYIRSCWSMYPIYAHNSSSSEVQWQTSVGCRSPFPCLPVILKRYPGIHLNVYAMMLSGTVYRLGVLIFSHITDPDARMAGPSQIPHLFTVFYAPRTWPSCKRTRVLTPSGDEAEGGSRAWTCPDVPLGLKSSSVTPNAWTSAIKIRSVLHNIIPLGSWLTRCSPVLNHTRESPWQDTWTRPFSPESERGWLWCPPSLYSRCPPWW